MSDTYNPYAQLYMPPPQPKTDYFGTNRPQAPRMPPALPSLEVDVSLPPAATSRGGPENRYWSPVDASPDVETPAGVGPATFLPNYSERRFLLVDDNTINLRILTKVLSRLYPLAHIVELCDSPAVVPYLESAPSFDCVFLDIEMPVVSGTQLASTIRKHPQLHKLPLIAVTTKSSAHDLQRYSEAGIDWTFSKPFNHAYQVVLDAVDAVLRQRDARER